ncbi:cobaltochelatase subunit CobN [Defluviimonas sp. 20V17]|uniref:Cobaltochelatase CobN subunit n=1 Tax=Allgaiera indica TaxID=765699 RepID=A0AAN4URR3_9RHOB|nr:cobaltochelatase subunit CobN [Allgaiera indica]KDB02416.1 cobaltochelatase subunit CobN [Defluviimonas sp. 20V17]GHE02121.1 cobaltochelatase subunit CobN [Allgaiera indica]SDX05226.1 cobaltochelatase CobN subunit [Allgaiera indica]
MHVVFRESHGLDETETPYDPGQDPADLVVLSFSDSDLGAFAAGWHRARDSGAALPTLRLCNLVALRHPLSVDAYVERTLCGAKAVLVRLIGGEAYWPYGLSSLRDLAQRRGVALAVLPGDGREDPTLDAFSTVPVSTLRRLSALCEAGGAVAAQAALAQLSLAAGLYAGPVPGLKSLPEAGIYLPGRGVVAAPPEGPGPRIAVTFYRAYLAAADTGPVDALIAGLTDAGFAAYGLFATSLKAEGPARWLATHFTAHPPAAIVNATAFSAQGADGISPLDGPGVPVFQVALSTARRRDWAASERGLSPADLAMHVVLPEVDGRLFAGVVSFKAPAPRDPDLQFSRFAHRAAPDLVAQAIGRIRGWLRLGATPMGGRDLAMILSTYPGRADQMAHAVGLDTLASAETLLGDLHAEGYQTTPVPALARRLREDSLTWPLDAYRAALATLPPQMRDALHAAWGPPEHDPALRDGAFHFSAIEAGRVLIALQPERGRRKGREDAYHDLAATPRHGYVAFYLWLQSRAPHALIHMGAHGTLEWLPGKSVALSRECWPARLTGDIPVIYPFIVNDPGEAAQAKRRIGALTLGHLPPPLATAELPENLAPLERLLDEYSTADGLDPARRTRLIGAIRDEARARGVEDDLRLPPGASPAEAITRIDRFVCDLKESRFGEGLHIFGRGACGPEERAGMLDALAGRRVAPGPAGSPGRGRSDVRPTGRNLFAVDPRAVPSRAAHAQGVKLAEELIRRHLQDHGDWPRGLVVDLWGSATMRTAGEEFAMALHLAGLAPRWDADSGRVSGFEVIPPALLNRPRIDVTLRVSGLFRDIFPGLAQLFEAGCAALAERDEAPEDNPYATRAPRVFGPKPGHYGIGLGTDAADLTPEARTRAGEAWLSASGWAIGADGAVREAREALESRLAATDAFVHPQDLPESDLLMAEDYAAHQAGFAAALSRLGHRPAALYHLDATDPARPRARALTEEIARTVRARAANPAWADGMMAHGFRGGAELAATLDHMAAFAHLAGAVPGHLFDLYHAATLDREEVVTFLERENPAALARLRATFRALIEAGLWVSRRNSVAIGTEAEA